MQLDTNKTVRELAVELPNAVRVFEKFGIDYCCGGGKSFADACAAANISPEQVMQSLAAVAPAEVAAPSGSLAELAEHIVVRHHTYVRQELPRLKQLAAKVAGKHGEKYSQLHQIEHLFSQLADELSTHMMKEEQILFPFIRQLEQAHLVGHPAPRPMFGTVRNPVQMMVMEHDSAGDVLKAMRSVSSNYTPPADACTSYQALFQGLQEFEADLHQHIHLENNILFPRAIELEQNALAAR